MPVSPTTVEAAYAAAPKDISAWLAGLRLEMTINGIDAPSTADRRRPRSGPRPPGSRRHGCIGRFPILISASLADTA